MKNLFLLIASIMSLSLTCGAVTYMRVHTNNGQVIKYDVDSVLLVDFEEEDSLIDTSQYVSVSGRIGNYTYVDLGLASGTKWATINVGATTVTEYGNYYGWGSITPYQSNAVDCQDSILTAENDAATANWGTSWRMPTGDEFQELINSCKWIWVDDFNGSGVAGILGTSKVNSNTIFLPAAGYSGSILEQVNSYGYYWSSCIDGRNNAIGLLFESTEEPCIFGSRSSGLSVRPVVR